MKRSILKRHVQEILREFVTFIHVANPSVTFCPGLEQISHIADNDESEKLSSMGNLKLLRPKTH